MICVHKLARELDSLCYRRLELAVGLCLNCRRGNDAVKVLLGHSVSTADEVAKVIGKVGIIRIYNVFIGYRAV